MPAEFAVGTAQCNFLVEFFTSKTTAWRALQIELAQLLTLQLRMITRVVLILRTAPELFQHKKRGDRTVGC
ncbi:hypothetical protein ACETKC_10855 [Brevundimonas intermedia]|uniref:hypothetical protein n=1 Tax=Brevundimonas intermedia TaxID=74315 RepID=UPI0022F26860|nr:hypothetical protein [Brevundimonas intermedia]